MRASERADERTDERVAQYSTRRSIVLPHSVELGGVKPSRVGESNKKICQRGNERGNERAQVKLSRAVDMSAYLASRDEIQLLLHRRAHRW